MKEIIINNKKVVFENKGEHIFCTSLDIARVFEKRHDNIVRDIKNTLSLMRDLGYSEQFLKIEESIYEQKLGNGAKRNNKMYTLNRDAFSLVAMGFTGRKAIEWKIAFINAFNTMEKELLAQSQAITSQQVFNLCYKTHCRDIVLQRVKEMEFEKNKQCVSINSYSVIETMKDNKINTKIEVTAEFASSPKRKLK